MVNLQRVATVSNGMSSSSRSTHDTVSKQTFFICFSFDTVGEICQEEFNDFESYEAHSKTHFVMCNFCEPPTVICHTQEHGTWDYRFQYLFHHLLTTHSDVTWDDDKLFKHNLVYLDAKGNPNPDIAAHLDEHKLSLSSRASAAEYLCCSCGNKCLRRGCPCRHFKQKCRPERCHRTGSSICENTVRNKCIQNISHADIDIKRIRSVTSPWYAVSPQNLWHQTIFGVVP